MIKLPFFKRDPSRIQMSKRIRVETYRMIFATVAVTALIGWKHEFVWTGMTSNIYLNGTIASVFLFGLFLAFRQVFSLRNEEAGLMALQEAYDDIRFHPKRAKTDPYWRHYRCLEPGKMFVRPKIFGHVYDLTYDKLMRTKHLRISVGTMQSLVREVELRFSAERSLLGYVTGILVFLGLIGTFIGLMDVVGSVGGILGSLAGGGGGDAADSFTKLITDLQAPLVGMATGFSSSLFGLFGSLVLGLITQFLTRACSVLKGKFESWLANIAEIESENDEAGPGDAISAFRDDELSDGEKVASAISTLAQSMNQTYEVSSHMAESMVQLLEMQRAHSEFLEQSSSHLAQMATAQDAVKGEIARQSALTATTVKAQREQAETSRTINREVAEGLSSLDRTLERFRREQLSAVDELRQLNAGIGSGSEAGSGNSAMMTAMFDRLEVGLDRLTAAIMHSQAAAVAPAPVAPSAPLSAPDLAHVEEAGVVPPALPAETTTEPDDWTLDWLDELSTQAAARRPTVVAEAPKRVAGSGSGDGGS